eukprot:CAMPEP_0180200896 /NCGR_PEP_ID=MMETSP0987-20121128/6466_1 /TAXON_ID=697907 /ORGANISM="non described non described, Strain CCMP2293" /LENGTH=195 /DNA_ID=CAMNT_0022156037 /DNA_START=8 /DNA_END=591 /DNA_ORIENTATION=+
MSHLATPLTPRRFPETLTEDAFRQLQDANVNFKQEVLRLGSELRREQRDREAMLREHVEAKNRVEAEFNRVEEESVAALRKQGEILQKQTLVISRLQEDNAQFQEQIRISQSLRYSQGNMASDTPCTLLSAPSSPARASKSQRAQSARSTPTDPTLKLAALRSNFEGGNAQVMGLTNGSNVPNPTPDSPGQIIPP